MNQVQTLKHEKSGPSCSGFKSPILSYLLLLTFMHPSPSPSHHLLFINLLILYPHSQSRSLLLPFHYLSSPSKSTSSSVFHRPLPTLPNRCNLSFHPIPHSAFIVSLSERDNYHLCFTKSENFVTDSPKLKH